MSQIDKIDFKNDFSKTLDNFDASAEFVVDKLLESNLIIDTILDSGTLKEIPIVNILNGLRKLNLSIKDYRFTKNLLKLLKGFGEIPLKDRIDFTFKYFHEEKDREYFSEKMLYTLENIDFSGKVDMITLILKKRIYEKITNEEFFNLMDVIFQIKFRWIEFFYDFVETKFELKRYITDHFYQCGLFESINQSMRVGGKTNYTISEIGEKFLEIIFENKLNDEYKRKRVYYYLQNLTIRPRDLEKFGGDFFKGSFEDIKLELDKVPLSLFIEKPAFYPNQFTMTLNDNSYRYDLYKVDKDEYVFNVREKSLFLHEA